MKRQLIYGAIVTLLLLSVTAVSHAKNITMTVIVPDQCRVCTTEKFVTDFQSAFEGVQVTYLTAGEKRAQKFIKGLSIEALPAYIVSPEVEKSAHFERFAEIAEKIGNWYYVRPPVAGIGYFLGRKKIPGKIDVFVLLTQPGAVHALEVARQLANYKDTPFDVRVHLIVATDSKTGQPVSPGGQREIEEGKLFACTEKYDSAKAWDYLLCRAHTIDSIWWDACLLKNDIDADVVSDCARNEEGRTLLMEKARLARELQIGSSPVFLLDNVEVFGITVQTTAEEIAGLFAADTPDKH